MKRSTIAVKLPRHDPEAIAPVTIFDAEGRVVRVVPAMEFHPPGPAARGHWPERRRGTHRERESSG